MALNSVFLHADDPARPHRVEYFLFDLEATGMLEDIECIGSYQDNPIWITTLAARHCLLQASELTVTDIRCLVLDSNKTEARIQLHGVPYHLPNLAIREALVKYEKVDEVARETRRVPGFQSMQSTSKKVHLSFRDFATLDELPQESHFKGSRKAAAMSEVPSHGPYLWRRTHCTLQYLW